MNRKLINPDIIIIQKAICTYFSLTYTELLGKRRSRNIVRPRQLAMYICSKCLVASLPEIGAAFLRDHTTVAHSLESMEKLFPTNKALTVAFDKIKTEYDEYLIKTSGGGW